MTGLEPVTIRLTAEGYYQLSYISVCEAQPSLAGAFPGVPRLCAIPSQVVDPGIRGHDFFGLRPRKSYLPILIRFRMVTAAAYCSAASSPDGI